MALPETAFFQAFKSQVLKTVDPRLRAVLPPAQGDFCFNYLNTNQQFNEHTYDTITANVSPAKSAPDTITLGQGSSFTNNYQRVIAGITFKLSTHDQSLVQQAMLDAQAEIQSLITAWQNQFGLITEQNMKDLSVPNKQDYIIQYISTNWTAVGSSPPSWEEMLGARDLSQLFPRKPASSGQVFPFLNNYISKMSSVSTLQDPIQNATWILNKIKANLTGPKNADSTTLFNPVDGSVLPSKVVTYRIARTQQEMADDLKQTSSLSITTSIKSSNGQSFQVSVSGGASFSIGSWLSLGVSGGASYDKSTASGHSLDCTVTTTWTGISKTPVGISMVPFRQETGTGCFYPDIIQEAVRNIGKDVTGYQFLSGTVPFNFKDFSQGGDFGLLTGVVLSNFPQIDITYKNSDFSSFKQSWGQQVDVGVTLFGFLRLGSASESTYSSSFTEDASSQSFTLHLTPKRFDGNPYNLQNAYILGGIVTNPGAPQSAAFFRHLMK